MKKRESLVEQFSELKDPRQRMNQEHKFIDIIMIAICATLCGADDWVAVEQFGRAKASWFGEFLELPNGIPSHDTFWRVFRFLDADCFESCFLKWVTTFQSISVGELIAIDGKQLRRSHDNIKSNGAIQLVSAWASENQLVLGQSKINEKSNEINAIPELLACLHLRGCLVAADALNCQTKTAQAILEQEADYLLALKGNHPLLYEDVALLFDGLANDLATKARYTYAFDTASQVDKGHGRIEVRKAWTINDPQLIQPLRTADKWPQLTTLIKVQAERYLGDHHSCETRYYISSASLSADRLLTKIRAYWSIENSLHWVLDYAFREDDSRLRKDHSPETFAILRRIALNLLKHDKSLKVGIKNKRLRAGWDHDYLLSLLQPLFHSP